MRLQVSRQLRILRNADPVDAGSADRTARYRFEAEGLSSVQDRALGRLEWTIRESFVDYVREAGGLVTVSDDIDPAAPRFRFPLRRSDAGCWSFAGSVTFEAYGGMLSVTVADPRVDVLRRRLYIRSRVGARSSEIEIAELSSIRDSGRELHARPMLTTAGVRLFCNAYPIGAPLDDLKIVR